MTTALARVADFLSGFNKKLNTTIFLNFKFKMMKTIQISILTLATAFGVASCNNAATSDSNNSEKEEMHEHEGNDHGEDDHATHQHQEAAKEKAEVKITATNMDEAMAKSLTAHYLALKNALVEDDAEAAKAAAAKMMEELKGTEDELGKKLLFDAEHISGTTAISHQRDHFESLSKNMYALGSQVKTGKELYWQHCPMAFDGKGANWLSAEEEIRNPYFGSEMLNCGRVEEKI